MCFLLYVFGGKKNNVWGKSETGLDKCIYTSTWYIFVDR